MAFDDMEFKARNVVRGGDVVGVAVYRDSSKDESATYVTISFSADIMTKMRWQKGDRITMAEGHGQDAMLLQVRKVEGEASPANSLKLSRNGGGKNATNSSTSVSFRIGRLQHHMLAPDAVNTSVTPVTHQIFGGSLTLMLPPFFVAKKGD